VLLSEGIEVDDRDYGSSLRKTEELLRNNDVVIFEGAFRFKNLFVRADIIEKKV
jgi:hypothetical protein